MLRVLSYVVAAVIGAAVGLTVVTVYVISEGGKAVSGR